MDVFYSFVIDFEHDVRGYWDILLDLVRVFDGEISFVESNGLKF